MGHPPLRPGRRILILTLLAVVLLGTAHCALPVAQASMTESLSCLKNRLLSYFITPPKTYRLEPQSVEFILDRTLTDEQKRALELVFPQSPYQATTSAQFKIRQRRILENAGFSAEEIDFIPGITQQTDGLLDASKIHAGFIRKDSIELSSLAGKRTKDLQDGKELQYFVDTTGGLHVSEVIKDPPTDSLWVLESKALENDPSYTYVIQESGSLRMDPSTKELIFNPSYGFETTAQHSDEIEKTVQTAFPESKIHRTVNPRLTETRILDCAAIMADQMTASSFVFDNVLASNLVFFSVLGAHELSGKDRISTPEKRSILWADFLGMNTNSIITSSATKKLIVKDSGVIMEAGGRMVAAGVSTTVQSGIYHAVLGSGKEDGKNKSAALSKYNRYYSFGKIPIKIAIDRAIIKRLPRKIFDACNKGSKLTLLYSPRSVRLIDQIGSTFLYFQLRGMMVDEK